MRPTTFRGLLHEAQGLQVQAESYLRRLTALREVMELAGTKDPEDRPDEEDIQFFKGMLTDVRALMDDL